MMGLTEGLAGVGVLGAGFVFAGSFENKVVRK